jgi:hypothetical protein
LRIELERRLNFKDSKYDIVWWNNIDITHLLAKTVGIIVQISYERSWEWKSVRDNLTRIESEIKDWTVWDQNEWYISQNKARKIMNETFLSLFNNATTTNTKRRTYKRK